VAVVIPAAVIPVVVAIVAATVVAMIPAAVAVVHRLRRCIDRCRLGINRCAERQADVQIRMRLRDTACARRESGSNQQVSDDAFHVVLL
jgi:hypothetical protein